MFPGACLELTRTLTALRQEDETPVLCKLGRGTVLTIAGITRDSGLIEATCVGKVYALFADDLEESAKRTGVHEQLVGPGPETPHAGA